MAVKATPAAARRAVKAVPAKTAPAPAAPARKHRDPARESAEFEVKEAGSTEARMVTLMRPTSGQMFIVLGMMGLADETDVHTQINMCNDFGTVLRTCFAYDDDERYVNRGMASARLGLEQFFDLALDMIQEWAPDEAPKQRAPRNGPAQTKRASVRRR